MLKLAKPQMSDQIFRREFTSELDFLSGETTFIEVKCRAGGWLNPDLVRKRDEVDLHRQIKSMEAAELIDQKDKFGRASANLTKEIGKMQFEAYYDACVVNWNTNIVNDGKVMACDKDHFIALADVRINEISEFYLDLIKYIDDLSNFVAKADEETEKN